MSVIRQFVNRIKREGRLRSATVTSVSMGRERVFNAYDLGADTFIFERGIIAHLAEHPSVLIVEKRALGARGNGRVMTISTGNHSVAAFPLLDGRFWNLSHLASNQRSEVLMRCILCANVVEDRLEISQREVDTSLVVALDSWLLHSVGFSLSAVQLLERNESTLEFYRRLGQEWRVKPLAWTDAEMRVALAASRKRLTSSLTYYHSTRGVHLLSFAEFSRFCALAESDPNAFFNGLNELVGVFEGNSLSFVRQPKYHGHHEIEFFGIRRGTAVDRLVPMLERIFDAISNGSLGQLGLLHEVREVRTLFRSLLTKSELADDTSREFIETLYMYVTGEIYAVQGEGSTPAFDDRRAALPGATFIDGRPVMHIGADSRTEVLMSSLRDMLSKDELVEYANVYELRDAETTVRLGAGATRELVYKTNRRPLEASLVEKELAHARRGYTAYMLSRVGALRALGISLSEYYRVLKSRIVKRGVTRDYYIRQRCEGEPMESIPASWFRCRANPALEEREVVLSLATLMGDAAAQNLAMKKFDPRTESPLYGVGKEIYDFDFDSVRNQPMPRRVSICSIRGSFGWPCLDQTDANFERLANFYFGYYAHAVKAYATQHHSVTMREVARRFMDGFAHRTHALAWQLSIRHDQFAAFAPEDIGRYNFVAKWRFIIWSLAHQDQALPALKKLFFEKLKVLEQ